MQPAALKEHNTQVPKPETANDSEVITPIHTDNYDHELLAVAKKELGDEVKFPPKNESAIQNQEALRHLIEDVNQLKDEHPLSLIGEAGVKDMEQSAAEHPPIPKKASEPIVKKFFSDVKGLYEQIKYGPLSIKPVIRFVDSEKMKKELDEKARLLGQVPVGEKKPTGKEEPKLKPAEQIQIQSPLQSEPEIVTTPPQPTFDQHSSPATSEIVPIPVVQPAEMQTAPNVPTPINIANYQVQTEENISQRLETQSKAA